MSLFKAKKINPDDLSLSDYFILEKSEAQSSEVRTEIAEVLNNKEAAKTIESQTNKEYKKHFDKLFFSLWGNAKSTFTKFEKEELNLNNIYEKCVDNLGLLINSKKDVNILIEDKINSGLFEKEKLDDEWKNKINKAMDIAFILHIIEERHSKEIYFIHLAEGVKNLIEETGIASINTWCAETLHDSFEDLNKYFDIDFLKSFVKESFNDDVVSMVEGVTKMERIFGIDRFEDLKQVLLNIVEDIRILYVKLADRLHNINTIDHLTEEKRIRIATETLNIYCPLARRFGMANIEQKLAKLSLKALDNDKYEKIQDSIDSTLSPSKNMIGAIEKAIRQDIGEEIDIDLEIRPTSVYKLIRKNMMTTEEENLKESFKNFNDKDLKKMSPFKIYISVHNKKDVALIRGKLTDKGYFIDAVHNTELISDDEYTYTGIVGQTEFKKIRTSMSKREMMSKEIESDLTIKTIKQHPSYKFMQRNSSRIPIEIVCAKDSEKNKMGLLFQNYEDRPYVLASDLKKIIKENIQNAKTVDDIAQFMMVDLVSNLIFIKGNDGKIFRYPDDYTVFEMAIKLHSDIGKSFSHAVITRGASKFLVGSNYVLQDGDEVDIKKSDQKIDYPMMFLLLKHGDNKTKLRNILLRKRSNINEIIDQGNNHFNKILKTIESFNIEGLRGIRISDISDEIFDKNDDNKYDEYLKEDNIKNLSYVNQVNFLIGIGVLDIQKILDCMKNKLGKILWGRVVDDVNNNIYRIENKFLRDDKNNVSEFNKRAKMIEESLPTNRLMMVMNSAETGNIIFKIKRPDGFVEKIEDDIKINFFIDRAVKMSKMSIN